MSSRWVPAFAGMTLITILAAHSLTTGKINVFKSGSAVSGGAAVAVQAYECPRCHNPHYENNTGLNYFNTTGIYK